MATFTPESKNAANFTGETKNSASFSQNFRHGVDLLLSDLASKTFTDTIFDGDSTQLKDITFEQLSAQTWTNQTKS